MIFSHLSAPPSPASQTAHFYSGTHFLCNIPSFGNHYKPVRITSPTPNPAGILRLAGLGRIYLKLQYSSHGNTGQKISIVLPSISFVFFSNGNFSAAQKAFMWFLCFVSGTSRKIHHSEITSFNFFITISTASSVIIERHFGQNCGSISGSSSSSIT